LKITLNRYHSYISASGKESSEIKKNYTFHFEIILADGTIRELFHPKPEVTIHDGDISLLSQLLSRACE